MTERNVSYTEQPDVQTVNDRVIDVPVPMVERTFRLLDLVSASEEGLTLSEMARALHMSRGSMHGLLKILESNGVLELVDEKRFVLGWRLYDLVQIYVQQAGL